MKNKPNVTLKTIFINNYIYFKNKVASIFLKRFSHLHIFICLRIGTDSVFLHAVSLEITKCYAVY